MTNQGDSQIRIQLPPVRLAKRDNIELIERRNQGPDNPLDPCGLVGQMDCGQHCTLG
jgi:hypothetical protein